MINDAYMYKYGLKTIKLISESNLTKLIIEHFNGDKFSYNTTLSAGNKYDRENSKLELETKIKEDVKLHSIVFKRKEKLQKLDERY
jgi:hypothetical protein